MFMANAIPAKYELGMARTMRLVLKNKYQMEMSLEEAHQFFHDEVELSPHQQQISELVECGYASVQEFFYLEIG